MPNLTVQVFFRLVLMGFIMVLGACGGAGSKIFVSNADTLLRLQVVKRIPLYSEQRDQLDKDIKTFLNKKRQEAPELLSVIDELKLDEDQRVEDQYRKIATFYDHVSLDFSAILSRYLAMLDSKQQKDFFETLNAENRELARPDPDDRMEKIKNRFKTFFGSIDEQQKQLLVNMREEFEVDNAAKLKRRKKLQQKFRRIYAAELSPESTRRMFFDAFTAYQKTAHDHEKNILMLKKVLHTLSPAQKEFFRKRVAEVKEILKLYLETNY